MNESLDFGKLSNFRRSLASVFFIVRKSFIKAIIDRALTEWGKIFSED